MRWVTTERIQVDRLASAWLIRRFVDTNAEFAFVPRETHAETVTDGTPFYLPGAALGKREGHSTFEAILDAYDLAGLDPVLVELGALMRAVDDLHGPVAFRGAAVRDALAADAPPETAGLQLVLHGLRLLHSTDEAVLAAGMITLDAVYAALRSRQQSANTG